MVDNNKKDKQTTTTTTKLSQKILPIGHLMATVTR